MAQIMWTGKLDDIMHNLEQWSGDLQSTFDGIDSDENGCNMLDVVLHDEFHNVGGAWSPKTCRWVFGEFLAQGIFVSKITSL